MRLRLILLLLPLCALLAAPTLAFAGTEDDPIVVIEVGDPMDQRLIDYVVDTIRTEKAHFYILMIDSPGVSSGSIATLYQAVLEASAPVVSWIGPHRAVAFGGAAYLANHADIRSAAPGSRVGYLDPVVQRGGGNAPPVRSGDGREALLGGVEILAHRFTTVTVDDPTVPGFVDRMDPALGQLILSLDGSVVHRGNETWELSTARIETVDGEDFIVSTRTIKFIEPGLLDQFLRLGARPETAFLFLVLGLAFAVFEFYAAGRGLMASVAALALVLSGYGLATLPIWWPAIALTFSGIGILVWGFAQNRVDWRAILGTFLVLVAGFTFTTSRPAYPPRGWMVLLAAGASVILIWYSLTTVVRGRFATPTVGREELIGKRCLAVSLLDPEGVVLVDGARWRATADRGVQIMPGAAVAVVGVTGLVLEVDPVVTAGREES